MSEAITEDEQMTAFKEQIIAEQKAEIFEMCPFCAVCLKLDRRLFRFLSAHAVTLGEGEHQHCAGLLFDGRQATVGDIPSCAACATIAFLYSEKTLMGLLWSSRH